MKPHRVRTARSIVGSAWMSIAYLVLVGFCGSTFAGESTTNTSNASIPPIPVASRNSSRNQEPDQICQLLFDTYIVCRGKIPTHTLLDASRIIAERGRNLGFYPMVLEELKKGRPESEVNCVRILGLMLSVDALARDAINRQRHTGVTEQWVALVNLGPEVVQTLIERAGQADRFCTDDYAIALARARVPVTTNFFRMILRDDNGKHYMATAKLFAAIGLAQLGEPSGYAWLVQSSGDTLPPIRGAWPRGIENNNLDSCCRAALSGLTGEKSMKTKADWEAWWKTMDGKSPPAARLDIVDSW